MQFQPPQQPSGWPTPQQPAYYPPPQMYYPPPMPQQIVVNQSVNVAGGAMSKQQFNLLIRLLYFLFFGWWIGITWACIALLFCATIIGLPIGLIMLHYLPAVLTLQQ
jgi:uncharacterized membrane protein YccF (DUF307 family)